MRLEFLGSVPVNVIFVSTLQASRMDVDWKPLQIHLFRTLV
jgi:hypothetical protein